MLHFVFPFFCIWINSERWIEKLFLRKQPELESQLAEKSNKYMKTCCCCVCCSFLMLCFYIKLYYWDDLVSLCASVSRFDSPHKYTHRKIHNLVPEYTQTRDTHSQPSTHNLVHTHIYNLLHTYWEIHNIVPVYTHNYTT